MADNSNTVDNISDFSVLAERLFARNKNDKQTEKLNKNIEGLNKSILAMAKQILPNSGLGDRISDISANRKIHNTLGENFRNRIYGNRKESVRNRYGSVRGVLDTFGIVQKGSGGMFDEALGRREDRNQFIQDQLKVNPQMTDTKENRKTFGKKFDVQQKIQKNLNDIQREIDRLKDGGFTDKQIQRSGLIKERDAEAAKLAASDNRLYSQIKDEVAEEIKKGILDGIHEAAKESEQIYNKKGEAGIAEYLGKPGSTINANQEALNEEDQVQQGILNAQNELVEQVKNIRDALDKEPEEIEQRKDSTLMSWLKGILGTIGGFLLAKMTGLVGMLTAGVGAVFKPLMKLLGIGAAADAVGKIPGRTNPNTTVPSKNEASKKGGSVASKVGGFVKNTASKIGKFALPALGLAGPIGLGIGAGALGYSMLPDGVKDTIGNKVSSILGFSKSNEESGISKPENAQIKIEKANISNVGDIISRKSEEIELKKQRTIESPTIISSPTTNNNTSNSVVNNHIKTFPRNPESSFNRYVAGRFTS